jgi:hypothetical protein
VDKFSEFSRQNFQESGLSTLGGDKERTGLLEQSRRQLGGNMATGIETIRALNLNGRHQNDATYGHCGYKTEKRSHGISPC